MDRPVNHHAYVKQPFEAIVDLLERDGPPLVQAATDAASRFAADLAGYLEKRLGFFDRDERVLVEVGALARDGDALLLPIDWRADATRRLLPNVHAALRVTPIISAGAAATAELTLQGRYQPPKVRRGGLAERAVARRVVDATLHTFLRRLADSIESALDPTTDVRPESANESEASR